MPPKTRASASYRPFKILQDLVRRGEVRLWPDTEKVFDAPRNVDRSLSDDDAFRRAMEEVRFLGWSKTPLRLPRPMEVPGRADDEREALACLQALVEGQGEVDPFATGEGIEGAPSRRGRRYLHKLKTGGFSVQAHLDLHGMAPAEAKMRFEQFIRESQRQGHCCVRIVHGRGRHSSSEPAVLKTHLTRWLTSRKMSRSVVAFASARGMDGGGGAVYVLLFVR